MHTAFFRRSGARYHPTPLTRGPWDERFQHGGPPSALLAGAMARHGQDAADFFLARVSLELLRPVPIAPLRLELRPGRLGRSVQRLEATLLANDVPVVHARGLRIRRRPSEATQHAPPPTWPSPEGQPRYVFPFFTHEVGYHKAVDLVLTEGAWGRTPVGFWGRPKVPLVEGRETLPVERVMILADAQSGMGVPLDPMRWSFVNPDLSVYLERPLRGEWLGLHIRSTANDHGSGLAQSALRDMDGVIGRSAQSLVVVPR